LQRVAVCHGVLQCMSRYMCEGGTSFCLRRLSAKKKNIYDREEEIEGEGGRGRGKGRA